MARTKLTAHKSAGGRAPHHCLAPCEPRPEPTEAERLRTELARVIAERNAAQHRLEQVTQERDQETLEIFMVVYVQHEIANVIFVDFYE